MKEISILNLNNIKFLENFVLNELNSFNSNYKLKSIDYSHSENDIHYYEINLIDNNDKFKSIRKLLISYENELNKITINNKKYNLDSKFFWIATLN
jgi:hypothetical protein